MRAGDIVSGFFRYLISIQFYFDLKTVINMVEETKIDEAKRKRRIVIMAIIAGLVALSFYGGFIAMVATR